MTPKPQAKTLDDTSKRLTELYNSHSFEDRKNKLRLGSVSTQLTTIQQIRIINKKSWQAQDRKLKDWAENVAESARKELL